jgi:hypothetical protein
MGDDNTLVHVPKMAAKTIARAVVKQARSDALDPTVPAEVRRDAHEFLADHPNYRQWCEVAGLVPQAIHIRQK